MDRGYKGGEIDTQLERVKDLQRDTLLSRESKSKDGTRIPLVLTFHPALNGVHEILRKCKKKFFLWIVNIAGFLLENCLSRLEGPKTLKIPWFGQDYNR